VFIPRGQDLDAGSLQLVTIVVEYDLRDECGNDHCKILTVRTGEVVRRGGIRPHLCHRIDGVGGEESAVDLGVRQLSFILQLRPAYIATHLQGGR
jgi:hypothetical protein